MAAPDQTGPSSPRGPIPKRTGSFGAGLSLLADQAQDRQSREGRERSGLGGDTPLSDSSVPGGGGGFQAPTYMARPADVAPPIAGELDETGGGFIGSTGEEAGRARQLQERQLAAARQFTGEGVSAPGEEPGAEAAGGELEEETEETEETEEEPSEGYDPAEIIRLQAAARRARTEVVEEAREEGRRTASAEDDRKNASRAIRMFLNEIIGAGGAAETFGLTFILSVVVMNLQMFGHFFLTHKKDSSSLGDIFFDQTFPETFETLIKTLCCCFALPIMPPCYIVTAIIITIIVMQKLYPLLFQGLHFLAFFGQS